MHQSSDLQTTHALLYSSPIVVRCISYREPPPRLYSLVLVVTAHRVRAVDFYNIEFERRREMLQYNKQRIKCRVVLFMRVDTFILVILRDGV